MPPSPDEIRTFLASCGEPVLLEPGEDPIPLHTENFVLEETGAGLLLQAWTQNRNLARKVTAVTGHKPGRLELEVQRFGKRTGRMLLLDRARPANHNLDRRAGRLLFRERLRRMLRRNFPDWQLAELTSEASLEHSLSHVYARGMLRKGATAWAVLGAPNDASAAGGALSFGLIWLDYLRRREKKLLVEGLALFLPAGKEQTTCLRLRWLNPAAGRFSVLLYGEDNWEEQINPAVHGNLATALTPAGEAMPAAPRIQPLPPEAMLELCLRRRLRDLDGALLDQPVYGQVPAVAGLDRGIADLLAAEHTGRLVVIELKAQADLHLPLQALDYWMRVHWHNQRGEFSAHGYFPGLALLSAPPRMLLVAPALEFHPTTEVILRYLSRQIEVDRFGLGLEWQKEVAVMFRLRGARRPY